MHVLVLFQSLPPNLPSSLLSSLPPSLPLSLSLVLVDGGGVKGNLVAVITGTLPPSPGGLWTPPFVADVTHSNARYLSLSAYDLNVGREGGREGGGVRYPFRSTRELMDDTPSYSQIPGPVLQTFFDSDIVNFYTQYYGSEVGKDEEGGKGRWQKRRSRKGGREGEEEAEPTGCESQIQPLQDQQNQKAGH